jgi:thiol:disulfide interchange protein
MPNDVASSESRPETASASKKRVSPLAVLAVLLVLFVGGRALLQLTGVLGPAPTPAVFEAGLTLDDALAAAEAEGKPVVAVVTADWCPPCQRYKRSTLAQADVQAWLGERTIAVMIDADAQPEAMRALGVRALPTTVVLRGGEVAGRRVGPISADELFELAGADGA